MPNLNLERSLLGLKKGDDGIPKEFAEYKRLNGRIRDILSKLLIMLLHKVKMKNLDVYTLKWIVLLVFTMKMAIKKLVMI